MSSSKHYERGAHASKSNLQSANQLIVNAITSITQTVESMHHCINPLSQFPSTPSKEAPHGITRMVYSTIRDMTELVGKGIDPPLGVISKVLEESSLSANGEALVAALNGVLGDHLVKQKSSLAIPMTLNLTDGEFCATKLGEMVKQSNGRLVIMVHGLCMNHLQWQREGHDHGKALAKDLNVATAYLHYNTGQHIFENGEAFSHLLEKIVAQILAYDPSIELNVSILAHSMGGLISKSALSQAQTLGHSWPDYLGSLIFLGTPHHGAPLEKAGGWLDMLLGLHNYTKPLSRLTKSRSAGIRDLRHGNILPSDSVERKSFEFIKDKRTPTPLPQNVNCFAVATTASESPNKTTEGLIGDGLVSVNSALGKHDSKVFTLQFPAKHQWIGRNISHMQLLSSADVYLKIKSWLER